MSMVLLETSGLGFVFWEDRSPSFLEGGSVDVPCVLVTVLQRLSVRSNKAPFMSSVSGLESSPSFFKKGKRG